MVTSLSDTNLQTTSPGGNEIRVFQTWSSNLVFCPGMIDIAVATVADLYEDNGGIPASLQFPKLDDVKADVNKVSAGVLKPGQAVIVNCSILNQAATLPGFAVPDMKKTFGLTGVVKSVDKVTYTYLH